MTKACAFCAIARGEAKAHVVHEDDAVIAFLDRSPLFLGHVLVVPRIHRETILDLDDELVVPIFGAAKRIAKAIGVALGAEGTFVAINNKISQSVPHLHVHVVPRKKGDGLRGFFWPRQKYESDDDMAKIAAAIASAL